MKIQCNICDTLNSNENILCYKCSKPLYSKNQIIENLFNRIELLEYRHKQEIQIIKKQINDLKNIEDSILKKPIINKNKTVHKAKENKHPFTPNNTKETIAFTETKKTEIKTIKQKKPSLLNLKIKEILTPLNEGIDLFLSAYTKYKKEGKLPIFLMTIAGIIAMLFGFGYLMQISFQYLGTYQAIAKTTIGFISAIALGTIGIRLSKKEGTLKEYGSALLSLGILLNYIMIYFMSDLGNFPMLASGILGFVLITINTIISIYFSIKYHSKIIAVISLIGGAFTPLYLNALGDGNLYYLYLWFLAIGSFYTSLKQKWKELNYITFAIIIGSLEFMVFKHAPNNIIYTVYYHLFTYLFFYISLFKKYQLKNKLEKPDLIILASSLSFLLYNLYSIFENNLITLGIIYLFNGFIFSTSLFLKWKTLNRDQKLILLIIIGSLVGLAIPSIFKQNLMGLFWSIEALALVIIGFNFSLPTVRKEGYILLAIAFGKLVFGSLSILNQWNNKLWHQGFLNYIILGAVLTSMWFIGKKHIKKLLKFEKKLFHFTQEIVPFWLATVYFVVGYHLFNTWVFNLSILPLFGFIYWKKHFNTKFSDLIGFSHLALFLISFLLSSINSNSYHFSEQTLEAKLALIEFMLCLWSLKYFYIVLKIEKNHHSFSFTQSLRILFFCLLPLILIGTVKRNAFEYIELSIWISSLISYLLFKKLRYKALKTEFYILSILALTFCYSENDPIGFISGMVFIITIVIREKSISYKILKKSEFKEYITTLPFILCLLIGSFILSLGHSNFSLSLSISSFSLLIFAYFYDKIGPIKNNYKAAVILSLIVNLSSLVALTIDESIISICFSIINIIIHTLLLNNKKKWFSVLFSKKWNRMMIFHQIECSITIAIILMFFNIDIEGPVTSIILAIHAVIILFVAMKNQIKILNKISIVLFSFTLLKVAFNDISDFNTTQKIIVLIILGLILLSASYGYVKLAKYFENKIKNTELLNSQINTLNKE